MMADVTMTVATTTKRGFVWPSCMPPKSGTEIKFYKFM
jgi:hypothetical protein